MQIFLHRLDGSQAILNIDSEITIESILTQNVGKRLIYEGSVLS